MGLQGGHSSADHRSLHARPRTPCSETLRARRAGLEASSGGGSFRDGRQKSHLRLEDYSGSLARSGSLTTPSSHTLSRSTTSLTSPCAIFDTALYDPSSDSIHIMPHFRQSTLESQFRDFKNKVNSANPQEAVFLDSKRPHSLNIPLTNRDTSQGANNETAYQARVPARASSLRLGHIDGKTFDLMAPPPGRRRSGKPAMFSSMKFESADSVDANPSEALTSQIASSILQERYGVRGTDAAPPKVQEAVRRCLQDVSKTIQTEHPQWDLPKYPAGKPHSPGVGSRSSSLSLGHRRKRTSPRIAEEDDDPFLYDKRVKNPDEQRKGSKKNLENSIPGQLYPCPFRRRDPILFNIRDHENCAKRSFTDILELKRHIRIYHRINRQPHHCPRCKKGYGSPNALSDHLTVPLEDMCEPRLAAPEPVAGDGISEDVDRILADNKSMVHIQSWDDLWRLLFPQDVSVLDPEFMPVVESFETEQEFDDSTAELKADLCESLQRLVPDQAGDSLMSQVLAGQLVLVFEQHRAKVNRRCRSRLQQTAGGGEPKGPAERSRAKASRFSVAPYAVQGQGAGAGLRSSLGSDRDRARRSRVQPPAPAPRTTDDTSPASSVYSQRSSSSSSYSHSRPPTRSSSLSTSTSTSAGGMQVESPRLPFRDWVHGVKLHGGGKNNGGSSGNGSSEQLGSGGHHQRDSGLALSCEDCGGEEPCACGSYADQLSAFMTPAAGALQQQQQQQMAPYGMLSRRSDERIDDWAAHYGEQTPYDVSDTLSGSGLDERAVEVEA